MVLVVEWALYKQMKMKPLNEEHRKRDAEYHAFCKKDAYLFENPFSRLFLYPGAIIMPIRFIIGWGSLMWLCFALNVVAFFCGTYGKSPEHQGPTQKKIVKWMNAIPGYCVLWGCSIIHQNFVRPTICYKKYLGPDWKPSYEGASSYVSNH